MKKRLDLERQPERLARCIIPTVTEVAIALKYENPVFIILCEWYPRTAC
jgi:hypothetical protein